MVAMSDRRVAHRELAQRIRAADEAYYVATQPLMSDSAYDLLVEELRALELADPSLATDSPLTRPGGRASFAPVRHRRPMLSLGNSYDREELAHFDRRLRESLGLTQISYLVEAKIDGLSCSLLYRDGLLVRAATRGDGSTGEDVTANVQTISEIPGRLHGAPSGEIEIRGEIYLRRSRLVTLNRERAAAGEPPLANTRNAAAGTLRQADPEIVRARGLSFFAYDIEGEDGRPDQGAALAELTRLGFLVEPNAQSRDSTDLIAAIDHFAPLRDDLDYDTDGLVIKVDQSTLQQRAGFVAREPRWAIAYKYPSLREMTRLRAVTWQVGRSGVVTPVGELVPVTIGGTLVARATLHNRDQIRRLGLQINDTVEIERAGEVIPAIVAVVEQLRDGSQRPIEIISDCPECGASLREEGPRLRCLAWSCPARLRARIEHLGARRALDIEGLGGEAVADLVRSSLVNEPADLFALDEQRLADLPGWGAVRAANLRSSIDRARRRPLARILFALGVPDLGEELARRMIEWLPSSTSSAELFTRLAEKSPEELALIEGMGPERIASLRELLADPIARAEGDRLLACLEAESIEVRDQASGPLVGTTICFTGSLSTPRDQLQALARAAGARVVADVTKTTTHLVAGSGAGAKLSRAASVGARVIDEAAFRALLATDVES